jgi:DNA-binding MarR family transcriptional regulator
MTISKCRQQPPRESQSGPGLHQIATTLRDIAALLDRRAAPVGEPANEPGTPQAADTAGNLVVLQQVAEFRRKRDALLGQDLFSDPAWDMLLELMASHLSGRPAAAAAQLCDASGVPESTARRHIARIQAAGLADAAPGDDAGRDTAFTLTPDGLRRLEALLAEG